MHSKILAIAALMLLASCSFFTPEAKSESIARVGDDFLFKSDITDLVPPGTSKEDSTVIVRSFVDRWASQKLLIKAAEVNLSNKKKSAFDTLIQQYKVDLYVKAYLEEVVKSTVDTVVSEDEIEAYYKKNKENFKTTGTLVRLRFVNLSKDHPKFETIRSKLFDFRKSDKKFWEAQSIKLNNFALNDSVWVDMNQVYSKLPFINPDNRDEYISSGKKIEHTDGKNIYLAKIAHVIDKNQIAPYQYIKPTLREVILNQRKLDLIKKFQKEITDDAIKDKKYEVYKP